MFIALGNYQKFLAIGKYMIITINIVPSQDSEFIFPRK